MIGIAGNVGRPAFVAFHQQPVGVRPEGHHRRKKQRLAQDHAVRLLHVRHDIRLHVRFAPGKPRERQRRRHQLQEIAPVDGFIPFRSLPRKFAMQQLLEVRIFRQLFQGAPILLAALGLQLGPHGRQIQRPIGGRQIFGLVFVRVRVMRMRAVRVRAVRVAAAGMQCQVLVFVVAHTVRQR